MSPITSVLRVSYFWCFLFSVSFPLAGQEWLSEPCHPIIHNYTPEEFGSDPKCVAILQDERGIIYSANERGVLEYDGVKWNLITVGIGNDVQALAKSADGTIYVGGLRTLGYLQPDKNGKLSYVSIKDQLPPEPEYQNFGYFRDGATLGEDVFLRGERLLVRIRNRKITGTWKVSGWKGFKRYDFKFEQRAARMIIPKQSLPGNPWVWRARFPDYHSEIDSMLAAEGFHIVHINTNDQYGSPKAVAIWDKFYAYLVGHYKFQKKVVLYGHSRGGLFVYNWAKKNPEKVACIYADAPVCDFNSWPAGFGSSKGSANDWKVLMEEYEFNSEEEAKAYADNPIDNLGVLAAAKVPILHTVGLNDKVVPPEENTLLLFNKYIRLGGVATIAPCTEGIQKPEGHHYPIDQPRMVTDFITYHASQNGSLSAADFHQMRGGNLQNCNIKFEQEKKGRVAFLGGSITYNSGWRDSVCAYLTKRFPDTEFEFIAAGIPSMGTTPAAFRLERDVLVNGPIDLLFEEAAVNDASNGRTKTEQIRAMEGIIRHSRHSNPNTDIVMMHFVDPDKMEAYRSGKEPDVINNHNRVATHYQIPTINLAKEVTERIDHGEFTWEDDFINLHPSPFGQGVYAHSIIQFLDNAFAEPIDSNDKISAHAMPGQIDKYAYDDGYLLDISNAKLSTGWSIDVKWNPNDGKRTRANFVDVPMLVSTESGSSLKVRFEGKAIGIAVAAGQDAGMVDYRIDKGDWQSLNLFTKWSDQVYLPWYYTLSAQLEDKKHVLELRIASNKDGRSNGQACRIRYFFVN